VLLVVVMVLKWCCILGTEDEGVCRNVLSISVDYN
jgi:hypothetical protein